MTEASQIQPTNDRPSYAELFRKLSNEIPLRGSRLFNSGISATLRRLDPETEFSTPALVRALVDRRFSRPERAKCAAARHPPPVSGIKEGFHTVCKNYGAPVETGKE
jgi:hypothetical protein